MFHCQQLDQLPDLLALHRFKTDAYPYLLASNTSGEVNSRFSILMAYPAPPVVQDAGDEDCLQQIDTRFDQPAEDSELPFIGGWFVFLSYEYASVIESGVDYFSEQSELPMAFISRVPAAVILDHQLQQGYVVADRQHGELIERIQQDLAATPELAQANIPPARVYEEDPAIYRDYLRRTHQYIVDGDIFQANLSRQWRVEFDQPCDPVDLYQSLREANPSPFAALIKFGDYYVLSSSPERLISVTDGVVETRPIAGTHPRGQDQTEDRLLSQKLLQHPKERAEHVMLIDLERNDLGRICQPGSIQVQDNMVLETYSHVHHIVSSISGRLRPGLSAADVVHAVFPGGTITGCPKVRCMQIISELEQAPRGAYTGSLGYISDHGRLDLNILIRTMSFHANQLTFRAGAGIVSDSQTERELNETRHKAKGMLNALQPDQ